MVVAYIQFAILLFRLNFLKTSGGIRVRLMDAIKRRENIYYKSDQCERSNTASARMRN